MRYITSMLLSCFFIVLVSCNSNIDEALLPNDSVETSLIGTYRGLGYTASIPNGITEGNLSGSLVLKNDGTYSSTISPFALVEAIGDWSYVREEEWIVFNEGEISEEKGENLTFRGDTLLFTIFRGELTSQTVIDFVLLKE